MTNESSCPTSSPAFSVASVLDFGHSNTCVVISHCGFNLHFPDGIRCRASFHRLICHLYISFLVKCLLRGLTHFFLMLFVLLLLYYIFFVCVYVNVKNS